MTTSGVSPPQVLSTEQEVPQHSLSAIDRQYAAQPNIPRRIHIIGTGSIGKLVAHSLRAIENPPPVTLIFHRYKLVQAWQRSKQVITVQDGEFTTEHGGYEMELAQEVKKQHSVETEGLDFYDIADETGMRPHEVAKLVSERKEAEGKAAAKYEPVEQEKRDGNEGREQSDRIELPGQKFASDEPIHNLIVTTKTIRTLAALSAIKHRLSRESTICFLQNGMGIIDDVNKDIFPDEATRPNYVQGVVSHGANVPPEKAQHDPFFVVHAGHGTIALGAIPRKPLNSDPHRPPTPTGTGTLNDGKVPEEQIEQWSPSTRYILRTLTRCPVLCAVGYTPIELLQLQLEKLAVNSILNPLTALLDNRNGTLLYNFALTRTMRLMLAETSLVIRSLPELRGLPNVPHRFSPERLETLVVSVSNKTQDNISSMLADVRGGRQTEVEYINGYIVKRGEEMGIKPIVNYAIMQTVIGKCLMVQREVNEGVPIAGQTEGVNRE